MTVLPVSHVKELIGAPLGAARITPICLRVAKYVSVAGAVAAVATIIYGIVTSIIPFIVLGAIFLATSVSSFYSIHQVSALKTIEEDSEKIKTLTEDLSAKNGQIEQLTSQIRTVSEKFAVQNKEYVRLTNADNAAQKLLNQQMQRSSELLAKTQAEAQKKMEQFRTSMTDQIQQLQKQSQIDQQTIADLNLTVAKAKDQNSSLQTSLTGLQKQTAAYQQQVQTYASLNDQLGQKLQKMSQAVRSPEIDIAAINAHAATMQDALAKQKVAAEKAARTAAQINSTLDALNQKLPSPKTPQPAGK